MKKLKTETYPSWTSTRRTALQLGESLALATSHQRIPIRMRDLFPPRRVTDVIFRPLLMGGCLGITKNGFTILVRCDADRTEELLKRLWLEDVEHRLPVNVRFTIAHEIAHTFFFDLTRPTPSSKVRTDSAARANDLEVTCNKLAARILFPKVLLQKEAADVLTPTGLRGLARKAGVSTKLLVVRMAEAFDWSGHEKAVICMQESLDGWQVGAVAAHSALRPILAQRSVWTRLAAEANSGRFVCSGGKEDMEDFALPCAIGDRTAVQQCTLNFEAPAKSQKALFLTISRRGGPTVVRGDDIPRSL
jgi:hypothetical protein